jgi:hypothetical protein
LSGQGWWQAAILRPPLSVPALLAVVADRAGEEANDGEVVADQARSEEKEKEKEKKIHKINGKIRKIKKEKIIYFFRNYDSQFILTIEDGSYIE